MLFKVGKTSEGDKPNERDDGFWPSKDKNARSKVLETIKGEGFFIEHNGDCWQSVFTSEMSEKSQLHDDINDAFRYMTEECQIKDHITVINPYKI